MSQFEQFKKYLKGTTQLSFVGKLLRTFGGDKMNPESFEVVFDAQFNAYLHKFCGERRSQDCSEELFNKFIDYVERETFCLVINDVLIRKLEEYPDIIKSIPSTMIEAMRDEICKKFELNITEPIENIEDHVAQYIQLDAFKKQLIEQVCSSYKKEIEAIQKKEHVFTQLSQGMLARAQEHDRLSNEENKLQEQLQKISALRLDRINQENYQKSDHAYAIVVAQHQEITHELFDALNNQESEEENEPIVYDEQHLSDVLISLLDNVKQAKYDGLVQLSQISFNKINDTLINAIDNLEKQSVMLDASIGEKKAAVQELEKKVKNHLSDIERLKLENKLLQEEIVSLKESYRVNYDKFRDEINQYEKQKINLLKDGEGFKKTEEYFVRENKRLNEEYSRLKHDFHTSNQERKELAEDNNRLHQRMDEVGKALDDAHVENKKIVVENKKQHAILDKTKKELEKTLGLMRATTEKIAEIENILSAKEHHILALQSKIAEQTDVISKQKYEIEKQNEGEQKIPSLYNELKGYELEVESDTFFDRVDELNSKSALNERIDEIERLKQDLNLLQKANSDLTGQLTNKALSEELVNRLSEELSSAKEREQMAQKEMLSLKTNLKSIKELNGAQQRVLEATSQKNQGLANKVFSLEEKVGELNSNLRRVRKALKEQEALYDDANKTLVATRNALKSAKEHGRDLTNQTKELTRGHEEALKSAKQEDKEERDALIKGHQVNLREVERQAEVSKQQIQQLQSEVALQASTLDGRIKEIDRLQKEVKTLDVANKDLLSKVSLFEPQVSALQIKLEQKQGELEKQQASYAEIKTSSEQIQKKLNDAIKKEGALKTDVQALSKKHAQELDGAKNASEGVLRELKAQHELDRLKIQKDVTDSKQEIEHLNAKLLQQGKLLDDRCQEISKLSNKLSQATSEQERLTVELRQATSNHLLSANEVLKLSDELNQAKEEALSLETNLKNIKELNGAQQRVLEATSQKNQGLANKVFSFEEKVGELNSNLRRVRDALKEQEALYDDVNKTLVATRNALKFAKEHGRDLTNQTKDLTRDHEEALKSVKQEDKKERDALIKGHQDSMRKMEFQAEASKQQIQQLQSEVALQASTLDGRIKEIDRLQKEVKTLDVANKDLLSKVSLFEPQVSALQSKLEQKQGELEKQQASYAEIKTSSEQIQKKLNDAIKKEEALTVNVQALSKKHAQELDGAKNASEGVLRELKAQHETDRLKIQEDVTDSKQEIEHLNAKLLQQGELLEERKQRIDKLKQVFLLVIDEKNRLLVKLGQANASHLLSANEVLKLSDELNQLKPKLNQAKEDALSLEKNLKNVHALNKTQQSALEVVGQVNQDLANKVSLLEEHVNQRESAFAHEKELHVEKDKKILELMAELKQLLVPKGILELTNLITSSRDHAFVHAVARLGSKAALMALDIESLRVLDTRALLDEEQWQDIINAAKKCGEERARVLEHEAIHQLKSRVEQEDNLSFLQDVVRAKSNDDLKLTCHLHCPQAINYLWENSAFEGIVQVAQLRLDFNQKGLDALKRHIEHADDRCYLDKIVKSKNNAEFIVAIDHPLSTRPLLHVDGYSEYVEIAKNRLLTLDSKRQVATNATQTVSNANDNLANILVEKQGILEFTEHKVQLSGFGDNLPVLKDKRPVEMKPKVLGIISGSGYYQGVHLDPQEVVRAYKVYTDPKQGVGDEQEVSGVAVLKQEETGTVHNMSYGKFTDAQKTEIVLKQAQMLLLNYKPKFKDPVIRLKGCDPDMTNRLFAACLALQKKHPHLKNIKISSKVSGSKRPEYSFFKPDRWARDSFIKTYLVSDDLDILTEQVTQTADVQFNRFKDAGKHPNSEGCCLKEDDTINNSGHVTRGTSLGKN